MVKHGPKIHTRKKFKLQTASLDRIDSQQGYNSNNIQFVHKDVNMIKQIYTQDYFIKMCKLVAEHNT